MSKEDKKFINEQIVSDKKSCKYIVVLKLLCSAVIFGIVAMATAIFSKPQLEKWLINKSSSKESISIAKDTTAASSSSTISSSEDTEAIKDIAESLIDNYSYDEEDLSSMYKGLAMIADKADNSVVSIYSIKNEKDWFDNYVEAGNNYSGVIIARTDTEIVILCPIEASNEADSIRVSFHNKLTLPAVVKALDGHVALATLSVDISAVDKESIKDMAPIPLGNSYLASRGDVIISMGSPMGFNYSIDYAYISYIAKEVSVVDSTAMFIYSSAKANPSKGSFVLNTAGELIAIASTAYASADNLDNIAMIGISDLKSRLEHMINATQSAYIGIKPMEVNDDMIAAGLPAGIYVAEIVHDSPAYNSGIQVGDIIVELNDEELNSIAKFKEEMEILDLSKEIDVKLQRDNGKGEYERLDLKITLAGR